MYLGWNSSAVYTRTLYIMDEIHVYEGAHCFLCTL
jgi:hypothetical protein